MIGNVPGIVLAVMVAFAAKVLVTFIGGMSEQLGQVLSPTIVAIVLGILIRNTVGVSDRLTGGVQFAAKYILMLAIVILGATLNFNSIIKLFHEQPGIIFLIMFNICMSFSIAYGMGKLLKIALPLRTFIGGGCSICGGTAISTLGPIIKAHESHIAFGISIVFFLDMITISLYPALGNMLHLSPEAFGILAGTAINDTSSVLAAGDIYSKMMHNDIAYETASIVKLTRTSFLVVVAGTFSVISIIRQFKRGPASMAEGVERHDFSSFIRTIAATFPWFILFFSIMSFCNTVGLFNNSLFDSFAGVFTYKTGASSAMVLLSKDLSKFLIIVALAAVGLKSNLSAILAPGLRPFALGFMTAFAVLISSFTTISLWLHL